MIRSFLHNALNRRFERRYGYDASYMHEIIDQSLPAFFKFNLFMAMAGHRDQVPLEASIAAGLAAVISEDCGPCTQLNVDMALKSGIAAQTLSALLRGQLDEVSADAALGYRYGLAVANNTSDAAALSQAVATRWGKRALISLAYTVASTRVYPTLKRGLGHGAACTRVQVEDHDIVVHHAA